MISQAVKHETRTSGGGSLMHLYTEATSEEKEGVVTNTSLVADEPELLFPCSNRSQS